MRLRLSDVRRLPRSVFFLLSETRLGYMRRSRSVLYVCVIPCVSQYRDLNTGLRHRVVPDPYIRILEVRYVAQ